MVLRDGSTVRVRPIRSDDESQLYELLHGLSEDSRTLRFFGAVSDYLLKREAERESHVDYARTFGLVATAGRRERIVGHAEYAASDGDRAEVSFAVADACQGQGLGTILLGQLSQIAFARDSCASAAQPGCASSARTAWGS